MPHWIGHCRGAGGGDARHPGQRQQACEAQRLPDGVPVPLALLSQLERPLPPPIAT